ncbi:PrgI family protein [Candidatus Amesbacteria bacterium]|nr:PrgI family protein [Candidatus Amesbacteria bacterium]
MDQHPVPQNISSYEFRLVGDMTLKQFLQLAGGGFVGLIFYRLPLPLLLKWPLIFLSIFIGIMLAFIPVQGRPFSAWLLAFIRAVYSPTEFFWEQKVIQKDEVDTSPTRTHTFSVLKFNIFPIIELGIKRIKALFPKPPIINTSPPAPSPKLGEGNSRGEVLPVIPIPPAVESIPVPDVEPVTHTDLVSSPETANILSGLIYDNEGKIVEGAIVEIINSETGIPVRALRSNKLGQFTIATPLSSGKYTIITEKDGLVFDPVSIQVNNSIIKSILLKAK